jgi:hypothetical protein
MSQPADAPRPSLFFNLRVRAMPCPPAALSASLNDSARSGTRRSHQPCRGPGRPTRKERHPCLTSQQATLMTGEAPSLTSPGPQVPVPCRTATARALSGNTAACAAQITHSGAPITDVHQIAITVQIGGYLRVGCRPALVTERNRIRTRCANRSPSLSGERPGRLRWRTYADDPDMGVRLPGRPSGIGGGIPAV